MSHIPSEPFAYASYEEMEEQIKVLHNQIVNLWHCIEELTKFNEYMKQRVKKLEEKEGK